jgi:hypothetical protein
LPTSLKGGVQITISTHKQQSADTQTAITTFANSYQHVTQTAINTQIALDIHTHSYHQKHEELSTQKQLSTHTNIAINTQTAINARAHTHTHSYQTKTAISTYINSYQYI